MVSLMQPSASWDNLSHASRFVTPPPHSPAGSFRSASSGSLNYLDEENDTVTANGAWKGKQRSKEDLKLLAINTSITELSYSISDIQTRIFEIQELRHQSEPTADGGGSGNIDQALSLLDDRLESVAQGLKSLNESIAPYVQSHLVPDPDEDEFNPSEETVLVRKHEVLLAEWAAVQTESDMLREELREDKWLTVFRTVTEQADGMMASLEKAVNRCQDFVLRFNHGTESLSRSSSNSSMRSDNSVMNLDTFMTLSDAYEAKKKHYMPATSKVLSILDKGVQDRVTKNGECLRRHAESTQRWQTLQQRIADMDSEMDRVRFIITSGDMAESEAGSSVSKRNGYLATPEGRGKSDAPANGIKSPFRKLARKLKGNGEPATPSGGGGGGKTTLRMPSGESNPPLRRQRTTIFSFGKGSQPTTPTTPERPGHRPTQSAVVDNSISSASRKTDASSTTSTSMRNAPRWNASTKVDPDERERLIVSTSKQPNSSRRPSAMGFYSREPSAAGPSANSSYMRSVSRSSMSSSRPWSPVNTSMASSAASIPPIPNLRPGSRTSYAAAPAVTPRSRPKTPSHIPSPRSHQRTSSMAEFSPTRTESDAGLSHTSDHFRPETPSGISAPPPRPPSRSMIPMPSVHLTSASRPGSAMSAYAPDMSIRAPSLASTPSKNRSWQSIDGGMRSSLGTPASKLPPSSFRDTPGRSPGGVSRAPSRAGAQTPLEGVGPTHIYAPINQKDPLDVEFGNIVNNLGHSFVIERVDPPLKAAPKPGDEVRGQYAFSTPLGRKIVNCKLTTMSRAGTEPSRKVLCRVGGGWQELRTFLMSKQIGL